MTNNQPTNLEISRKLINAVDKQIVARFEAILAPDIDLFTDPLMKELLNERQAIVRDIAIYKKKTGIPIFDPEREKTLIERNCTLLRDRTHEAAYRCFIAEILKRSKAYQQALITSLHHDEQ